MGNQGLSSKWDDNVNVLITGATGNIGHACVQEAVTRHWDYDGIARHSLATPHVYSVDLCVPEAVETFLIGHGVRYDLVVMAHGTQCARPLCEFDEDYILGMMDNNLLSFINLTSWLARGHVVNDGGLIVYCSSIQASNPRAGRGAYAICKAGIEALARSAAVEMAPVRTVAFRLGQLTETMKGVSFDPVQRQSLEARSILPWVEPCDVAKLCFDLYTQKSLTGATLDLSSGHILNIW